jgi:hypothetical protein
VTTKYESSRDQLVGPAMEAYEQAKDLSVKSVIDTTGVPTASFVVAAGYANRQSVITISSSEAREQLTRRAIKKLLDEE